MIFAYMESPYTMEEICGFIAFFNFHPYIGKVEQLWNVVKRLHVGFGARQVYVGQVYVLTVIHHMNSYHQGL